MSDLKSPALRTVDAGLSWIVRDRVSITAVRVLMAPIITLTTVPVSSILSHRPPTNTCLTASTIRYIYIYIYSLTLLLYAASNSYVYHTYVLRKSKYVGRPCADMHAAVLLVAQSCIAPSVQWARPPDAREPPSTGSALFYFFDLAQWPWFFSSLKWKLLAHQLQYYRGQRWRLFQFFYTFCLPFRSPYLTDGRTNGRGKPVMRPIRWPRNKR